MVAFLSSWQNLFVACSVVGALAVAAPVSVSATDGEELTLDQIPNADNLFGGDIDTEYHLVKSAFGLVAADEALRTHSVTFDKTLEENTEDEDADRRLGASNTGLSCANCGANLWEGGVLTYVIDETYGTDAGDLRTFDAALNEISTKTGITFRERTSNTQSYVRVIDGTGCSSAVGDTGNTNNGQSLKLKAPTAENGGTCRTMGIIAHEFLHALGLWHQQSTSDRDTYVNVNLDNVPANRQGNFNTLSVSHTWTPYDYGSVMHYGRLAFSTTSSPNVLSAIGGSASENSANTAKMGQRTKLSATDAIELQIMYHCTLAGSSRSPPSNIADLCSTDCPCAEGQGGCSSSDQCQGDDLFCARNYGFYKHLGQEMVLPGLNSCVSKSLISQYELVGTAVPTKLPTNSPTKSPTKLPTTSPTNSPTAPTQMPTTSPTDAPTPFSAAPSPMSLEARQALEAAKLKAQEDETMYITIAIAGGCGVALVAVGVVSLNKAKKSKAARLANNGRGRGGGGKTANQFQNAAVDGGMSTFNPSFAGGQASAV